MGKAVDWGQAGPTPYALLESRVDYRRGTRVYVEYRRVPGVEIERGKWTLYLRAFFFPGVSDPARLPALAGGSTSFRIESETVDGQIWCYMVSEYAGGKDGAARCVALFVSPPDGRPPYPKDGGWAHIPLVGSRKIPLSGEGLLVVQLMRLRRGKPNVKVLSGAMAIPVRFPPVGR